ncbi:hypothetical protein NP493_1090g00061 [Ridgeia piscesae]|uniref:BHLH domain-containing protein n=1 Tax=Ridgeia piscesae TaxID=27915 RepID=A0AAD9NJV5_RIDPI|nr:hypothetical protein NP493_1090g00061 [Ridgeia piscesae]
MAGEFSQVEFNPAADTPRRLNSCMYNSRLVVSSDQRPVEQRTSSPLDSAGLGNVADVVIARAVTRSARAHSCYKHVPHREKPPQLVQRRNARERRRVQAVNNAFVRLRRYIPYENKHKRLSKVKTLRRAIDYIGYLQSLVTEADTTGQDQFERGSWKLHPPRWRAIVGGTDGKGHASQLVNVDYEDKQRYRTGQNL